MKALVCIVLVTMTISIYGQDSELLMKGDTVIIRGYGIVADPFMFGENALDFLMRMNGSVEVSTVENRHVDNKVDTIFTFRHKEDRFLVYQLERDENALIEATLKTTQFKTKHGIQVGMSKRDVINKLTDFVLQTIPQYLMLEDTEVYEYIILRFDGDQVKQIDFVGYID